MSLRWRHAVAGTGAAALLISLGPVPATAQSSAVPPRAAAAAPGAWVRPGSRDEGRLMLAAAAGRPQPLPGTPAARRGAPAYTVKVRGTGLNGQPASGDNVLLVDADNTRLSPALAQGFVHGVATFRVPAGHYIAYAIFAPPGPIGLTTTHLVVRPEFTVTADRSVSVTEASATSRVTMVTPRPASVAGTGFYLLFTGQTGPRLYAELDMAGDVPLWVSPTSPASRPAVGGMREVADQQLAARPAGGVPYAYALSYTGPDGYIPAQRYRVAPASLVTVDERLYRPVPAHGIWEVLGGFPDTFAGFVEPAPIAVRLPGRLTQYLGGVNRGLGKIAWNTGYQARGGGQGYELYQGPVPGAVSGPSGDGFDSYPLHPVPNTVPDVSLPGPEAAEPSADRAGDTLYLDMTAFDDNGFAHESSTGFLRLPGTTITGRYRVDQNGQQVASGNAVPSARSPYPPALYAKVPLAPAPSAVSFTLDTSRAGPQFPLSTATATVWTWRSARVTGHQLPRFWACTLRVFVPSCTVQPLITLLYQVRGLGLDESARPGEQSVGIQAGHLQLAASPAITGATMEVSFDGGRTWHRAAVTRTGPASFRAGFSALAGADVTMRTRVTDAAGGSVTATITRGYRIRGGSPAPGSTAGRHRTG